MRKGVVVGAATAARRSSSAETLAASLPRPPLNVGEPAKGGGGGHFCAARVFGSISDLMSKCGLPVFKDKRTPSPFVEEFPEDDGEAAKAALPDHIYMDAMGFGMGNCCLQVLGRVFMCVRGCGCVCAQFWHSDGLM